MGKRRESLGELYELCDNSTHNCSTYAEFTVYRISDISDKFRSPQRSDISELYCINEILTGTQQEINVINEQTQHHHQHNDVLLTLM